MVQINQYNVSVMEIEVEDDEELIKYLKPKLPLLKDYLLNLKGNVTQKLKNFLDLNHIQYTTNLDIGSLKRARKQKRSGVDVYDRVVRSGEEIVTDNSVLCLKKVNDGALIRTKGDFIGIERVDGVIESEGDVLIFPKGPKAKIIFHRHLLDNLTTGATYKIALVDEEILIEKIKD